MLIGRLLQNAPLRCQTREASTNEYESVDTEIGQRFDPQYEAALSDLSKQ